MDKTRDVFPGKIEPHVAETRRDFFALDSMSFGIERQEHARCKMTGKSKQC